MTLKVFNYTNDKYIEAEDTRAQISAIIGNKGNGFAGEITQNGNSVTVKAGSHVFVGGLSVRVLTDETFDLTTLKYLVVETTYTAPDTYSCVLKPVSVVTTSKVGLVDKHVAIWEKGTGYLNKVNSNILFYDLATQTKDGFLDNEDKIKLDKLRIENDNNPTNDPSIFIPSISEHHKLIVREVQTDQIVHPEGHLVFRQTGWGNTHTALYSGNELEVSSNRSVWIRAGVTGESKAVVLMGEEVDCVNLSNSRNIPIVASEFRVSSRKDTKTDIEQIDYSVDQFEEFLNIPVFDYYRIGELDEPDLDKNGNIKLDKNGIQKFIKKNKKDVKRQRGLVYENTPERFRSSDTTLGLYEILSESILFSQTTYRKLKKENELLEQRIEKLEKLMG